MNNVIFILQVCHHQQPQSYLIPVSNILISYRSVRLKQCLFFDITDGVSDKDIYEIIRSVLGDSVRSFFKLLSGVLALRTVRPCDSRAYH